MRAVQIIQAVPVPDQATTAPSPATQTTDDRRPATVRWLIAIVAIGLLLRLAVIVGTIGWPELKLRPVDAQGYDERAWTLVLAWSGEDVTLPSGEAAFSVFGPAWTRYDEVVAAIYLLVGRNEPVVQLFNAVVGVLSAVQLFLLARETNQRAGGWLAMTLALCLPSFVHLTANNLKEALVLFATSGCLLWYTRLQRRPDAPRTVLFLVDLALLAFVRAQASLIFAVGAVFAWFVVAPTRRASFGAVIGVALLCLAMALLIGSGRFNQLLENFSLPRLTADRLAQAEWSGSQLGPANVITTPAEAIAYLPLGLFYFFFAPLPHQVTGAFGLVALAETWLWYAIMPLTILGLVIGLRERDPATALILAFTVVYALVAALAVGNVGGLYRYRLPVWAALFVLADRGASALWLWRRARTKLATSVAGSAA